MLNRVAVYGSLRKDLHNHGLLETSNFLGEDTITGFDMYSMGSFPFLVPNESDTPISIEVYEVTPEVFASLDRLEGYPRFYDRKQIETAHGTSWIYFIEDGDTKSPHVVNGDWKEYFQSNHPNPYRY